MNKDIYDGTPDHFGPELLNDIQAFSKDVAVLLFGKTADPTASRILAGSATGTLIYDAVALSDDREAAMRHWKKLIQEAGDELHIYAVAWYHQTPVGLDIKVTVESRRQPARVFIWEERRPNGEKTGEFECTDISDSPEYVGGNEPWFLLNPRESKPSSGKGERVEFIRLGGHPRNISESEMLSGLDDAAKASMLIELASFALKCSPPRAEEAATKLRQAAELGSSRAKQLVLQLIQEERIPAMDEAEPGRIAVELAEAGNPYAQAELGRMYWAGQCFPEDLKLAHHWLSLAAEAGNIYAQGKLGAMYRHGIGVDVSYPLARKWCLLAADKGEKDAMSDLAFLYAHGLGGEADASKAAEWYAKAAAAKHPVGMVEFGKCLLGGKGCQEDLQRGLDLIHQAADLNEPSAYVALGNLFAEGAVVPQDDAEALRYYYKAVELGSGTAAIQAGSMKFSGKGCPADTAEALRLWTLAYHSRDIPGSAKTVLFKKIGYCYDRGAAGEAAKSEAVKWFRIGEAVGCHASEHFLAKYYYKGEHVAQDYAQSLRLFEMSLAGGVVQSNHWIGLHHLFGRGTAQDFVKAAEYFRKDAEEFTQDSYAMLAEIYERGLGVPVDMQIAAEWRRKAKSAS
jgi:TPR repeat protein